MPGNRNLLMRANAVALSGIRLQYARIIPQPQTNAFLFPIASFVYMNSPPLIGNFLMRYP